MYDAGANGIDLVQFGFGLETRASFESATNLVEVYMQNNDVDYVNSVGLEPYSLKSGTEPCSEEFHYECLYLEMTIDLAGFDSLGIQAIDGRLNTATYYLDFKDSSLNPIKRSEEANQYNQKTPSLVVILDRIDPGINAHDVMGLYQNMTISEILAYERYLENKWHENKLSEQIWYSEEFQ